MDPMRHVHHLSVDIGARGSTTSNERAAAEYIHAQLKAAGHHPITESFRSARSAWSPAALFWGIVLLSGILFWWGGRAGASVSLMLTLLGLGSMLLELCFISNPLRWVLPRGDSQNVWTRVAGSARSMSQVVLVAHMDTHRTPKVFSTNRWVRWFERLVPIGMALAIAQILVFGLGAFGAAAWLRYVSIGPSLAAFGMLALMLQANRTPFSPGANDNASGVGLLLELGSRLAEEPLTQTDVWLLFTGCEEVGSYGAQDFIRRHRSDLPNAAWVVLDNIGSTDGHPVFLSKETFLLTAESDPALVGYARDIAAQHPTLGVAEISMKGAYTDGAIGAKNGLRVLTLESHGVNGTITGWHRPSDVVDNVSESCVLATGHFITKLLGRIDEDTAP